MIQRDLTIRYSILKSLIKSRRGLIAIFRESLQDDKSSASLAYRQNIQIFRMYIEVFNAEYSLNKPIHGLKDQFLDECLQSFLDIPTQVPEGKLPFLPSGYFELLTFLS